MFVCRRFLAIAQKEFIHILRDWRSLFLALAIPAVLIFIFGYALTFDLKNTPVVVWDQSRSTESRELLSFFEGSKYFSIKSYHDNYNALEVDINKGKAMLAIVIPSTFAKDLFHKSANVQIIGDGSDANTMRLALGYVKGIASIYNQHLSFPTIISSLDLSPRAWYNLDLRSQNAIIPGIIAIVLIVIVAMLTSITVAKEWEMGTMEQLLSTPIRKTEFILGKITPYYFIGMLDVVIAIILSRYLFDVPLRGNPALLFCMSSLFLSGALFFGLMLSITFKSQVLSNQIALLATFLPTMLLSGFVFSIPNMPIIVQYITYIVPARYFIAILKGIYLKGIGLEVLWLNALLLLFYAVIMFFLSLKKFKLKLD